MNGTECKTDICSRCGLEPETRVLISPDGKLGPVVYWCPKCKTFVKSNQEFVYEFTEKDWEEELNE